MDFHQNISDPGNAPLKQKWSSSSMPATSESANGCFDCSICLDSSNEPVVTLCGHLYCWPCIYKWLQVQHSSSESDGLPKCPVCKAYFSTSTLVPLYGRGTSPSQLEAKKLPQSNLSIPRRPPALGMNASLAASASVAYDPNQPYRPNSFHQQQHFSHPFGNYTSMAPALASTTTNFFCPTINMVSEMVFAGIFGNSDTTLFAHPNSNSYTLPGNGSSRLRRHEMQLDKSLNRVSIFLFCCIVLCLILF